MKELAPKMISQDSEFPFVLASASPRRRELLNSINVEFEVLVADIVEERLGSESASEMVSRLAQVKAANIVEKREKAWVLAADTMVVCQDEILGKPTDRKDALRMLTLLQGRKHLVLGGVCLWNPRESKYYSRVHETEVELVPLDVSRLKAYIASGEPMDKAGSYAIQGLGMSLVKEIKGSYSNVVGLDIAWLSALLHRLEVLRVG